MAFESVPQAIPNFPLSERKILELWKARDVFHRSLKETRGGREFVFYEGPPTANGLPHNGHVLTRVIKDLFPRYVTMRGAHVERRAGWDTHGLPVEVEVEKELRISGKEAIIQYGVDRFSRKCLESVFRYQKEWEHLTERIAFWVDLDKAYVTYYKSYVESVWWALSQLFQKGLLYKGHKVVWWWAQGGTALSAGEVGNAYKTVDDPSVYVRFPLIGEDASLLVWTTTPWTLPSNMFAAVHADYDYSYVKDDGQVLIVASELVAKLSEKLGRPLTEEKRVKGKALIGKRYTPPFDTYLCDHPNDTRYFRVVAGDRSNTAQPQWFVTLDAGTGVVHMAPAFGDDDWKVWRNLRQKDQALEMFCAVKPDGKLDSRLASLGLEGVWVKDADKQLTRALKESGLLVHSEVYRHDYPFCWRSDTDPLIQYAREAWFIRTTAKIDDVIANNARVEWMPEHIKHGRFGDFLDGNVDWALSRERFWGTPLNVWECASCGHSEAPDSIAAIEMKNPQAFAKFYQAQKKDPTLSEHLIVHKPWIDDITFPCDKCKKEMRRVPEVIDCWFDSGCMPFAQLGYPHLPGSKEAFESAFPADFISEAIDQTRGWFYSLMMISNLLFESPEAHPYKRCIVLGHVADKHGKKESKSSGNYTPPEVILDAVRMEFAVIAREDVPPPKEGTALIGPDDFEGLDFTKEGEQVSLYAKDREAEKRKVALRIHKKLPRRVVVLSEADRQALGLSLAPPGSRPVEVPKLPSSQRVVLDADVPAPGADAFRWFFYASNPPWNNTRHALSNVRQLQKEMPIKLRNVYSFFVTYANIDNFDPVKDEKSKRSPKDRPLLDRWILSEIEKAKRSIVGHMDEFRSYEATQVISEFVEGLSNWYVRRSRDRFWAEGRGQDKLDAYWTLYTCLRDLSIMVAPFIPFAAEEMYQNLIVRVYGEGHPNSVHLRSYPSGDASRIDESLSRDMREVRDLVSLGLQVRTQSKRKVRQPLRETEIVLSDPARRAALEPYCGIMQDELNVKEVKFREKADEYVHYTVKPNFPLLGKRLGKKMKATQTAIGSADPNTLKRALDSAGKVAINVESEEVVLTKEELTVEVVAKEGFSAATAPVGVVVLDTTVTPELEREGLFREVLSRVQKRRKDLQLDFAARIRMSVTGDAELLEVVRERQDELKKETLCTELVIGKGIGGDSVTTEIEGKELTIEVATK